MKAAGPQIPPVSVGLSELGAPPDLGEEVVGLEEVGVEEVSLGVGLSVSVGVSVSVGFSSTPISGIIFTVALFPFFAS